MTDLHPQTLWSSHQPVHVWQVALEQSDLAEAEAYELLDAHERQRARMMVNAEERRMFTITHAQVRQVLAAYVGVPPQALSYRYGAFGKPRLAEPEAARALAFNIGYAPGVAAVALTLRSDVGIALAWEGDGNPSAQVEAWAWRKANGHGFASSVAAEKFPMPDWFLAWVDLKSGLRVGVVASGQAGEVAVGRWRPHSRALVATAMAPAVAMPAAAAAAATPQHAIAAA
ncbi:MAG TPA: hypothetical protein VN709_08890 [Terriglobales bacterium]|nr:hypothetical protein [Terriglobales bacterium]